MRILGNLVLLRDEKLFRWLNMEEWQYYDEPDEPYNPITREAFDTKMKQPRKKVPGAYTWQVDTIEGLHLGWVQYYELNENSQSTYIGICLPESEKWGKGYGTEAIGLLINYLLKEMSLKEVYATTWTGNNRMRRLAEKCGFKEIGRSPHRISVSVRGEPLEFIHYCFFAHTESQS
jgi:RimJ/RimL family protein N-acetyltransferase